jgi:hypothetical protein
MAASVWVGALRGRATVLEVFAGDARQRRVRGDITNGRRALGGRLELVGPIVLGEMAAEAMTAEAAIIS